MPLKIVRFALRSRSCYSHFAAIILTVFTFSLAVALALDGEAEGLADGLAALGSAIVATTSTW
jgi:hypothetical protein